MCHLLIANLRVLQVGICLPHQPYPRLDLVTLLQSHWTVLLSTPTPHSVTVLTAWNILPPDIYMPGLHSREYQLHRRVFSELLTLSSPLLPNMLYQSLHSVFFLSYHLLKRSCLVVYFFWSLLWECEQESCLSCAPVEPQCLELCLAHGRCSVNGC